MPKKFAELAKRFVLVQVDTRNGRSAECKRLLVQRNNAYFLFLDKDGREFYRMVDPGNGRMGPEAGRRILWEAAIARMEASLRKPPAGKEGAALLRGLLICDDPHLREEALSHLASLRDADAPFTSDLLLALDDSAVAVAVAAARALGAMGPKAKAAVPVLAKLLEKKGRHRQAMAMALGKIDRTGGTAVPVLTRLLKDNDLSVTIGAVIGFGSIGPAAAPVVGDLIPLLDARNVALRFYTVQTLGKIGPAAAAAKEKLQAIANEPRGSSLDTPGAAREALKRLSR